MIVLPALNFSARLGSRAPERALAGEQHHALRTSLTDPRANRRRRYSASIRYSAMKYAVKLTTNGTGRSASTASIDRDVRAEEHHLAANAAIITRGHAARIRAGRSARPAPRSRTATTSGPTIPNSTSPRHAAHRRRPAPPARQPTLAADHPRDRSSFRLPDGLGQLVEPDDDPEQQARRAETRATCPASSRRRSRCRRAGGSRRSACSWRRPPAPTLRTFSWNDFESTERAASRGRRQA